MNVGYTATNPMGTLHQWGQKVGTALKLNGDTWEVDGATKWNDSWSATDAEYDKLLAQIPKGSDNDIGQWRPIRSENPGNVVGRWFGTDCEVATAVSPGTAIFFPAAGYLYSRDGTFYSANSDGRVWSSTPNGSSARHLYFGNGDASMGNNNQTVGYSVRCVHDGN